LFEGKNKEEDDPFPLGFFVISEVEEYGQGGPTGRFGSVAGSSSPGSHQEDIPAHVIDQIPHPDLIRTISRLDLFKRKCNG
jgi:hypothetical protein